MRVMRIPEDDLKRLLLGSMSWVRRGHARIRTQPDAQRGLAARDSLARFSFFHIGDLRAIHRRPESQAIPTIRSRGGL